MVSRKKVSLSPIGRAIRKAQRDMRKTRPGLSVAARRRLNAKIRKLDRHYRAISILCRTWNPVEP